MAKSIIIPANAWTQIAPAGFGSLVIQPINGGLIVEFGATPPPVAESDWGVIYSEDEPATTGTDDPAAIMWGRPSTSGKPVQIRFLK